MHIAVFNQHHHNPDCPATCRHYSFLEELAKRHKVTLITSDGWRNIRLTKEYKWVPEGVKLYECNSPYANKMGVVQRIKSFSHYTAYALRIGMTMPKPDIIWAVSTPLSTPWAAAQVAKLRNVPWVFEVQDLWPQFPIEMGAVNNRQLKRLLYKTENKLYRSASEIITLSPDMSEYVHHLEIEQEKVTTILNGTDFTFINAVQQKDVESLREKYKLEGKSVVLYAGTYGRANAVPALMETIRGMASDESIVFLLAGNGYYEPQLQELASQTANLLLLPPQPRYEVFKLFKLADLSLVTFNDLPVLASNSPSKFYDSLACGTPVVVTNPGWTKDFVEDHGCGWYSPAEQPASLATTINEILAQPEELKLAGARGETVARAMFDRKKLAERMEEILIRGQKPKRRSY
ncbi:glycosyltransferase family 4 protein [Pontibacter locisalis]|uniref:Glycosyltransferase family 4 protein n=1 Tax=Pontibacter locisalis TaxID=1719035 RepID=A0ABW5IGH3_9BACT